MRTRKYRRRNGGGSRRYRGGGGGESGTTATSIIKHFMELIAAIKLYHWHTHQYAEHKSTDDLFAKMNDLVDKYVETMLGKSVSTPVRFQSIRTLAIPNFTNRAAFMSAMKKCEADIRAIKYSNENADLENMRDELVGHLNQFVYLMSFK